MQPCERPHCVGCCETTCWRLYGIRQYTLLHISAYVHCLNITIHYICIYMYICNVSILRRLDTVFGGASVRFGYCLARPHDSVIVQILASLGPQTWPSDLWRLPHVHR